MLPECEKRGVSILLGGAFNSGILARGLGDQAHGDLKFNYGDAQKEIVERVGRLERVCREFGVALSAAAIQFPYAHKVVATVLIGARPPDEVCANEASFAASIPSAMWDALRSEGLLHPDAPVPR